MLTIDLIEIGRWVPHIVEATQLTCIARASFIYKQI
jgi:hypothetical protein